MGRAESRPRGASNEASSERLTALLFILLVGEAVLPIGILKIITA